MRRFKMSEHITKLENNENIKELNCHKCRGAGINSCLCLRQQEHNCNIDTQINNKKETLSKSYEPFLQIANNCNRRLPQIGDVYTHFKGMKIYIVDLAYHTETKECLVIYKHEDTTWARPLEMFLSKVDKNKYPNVTQTYRLERELPWNITSTIEFKDTVEECLNIDRFKSFTYKEIEDYVLKHFYL